MPVAAKCWGAPFDMTTIANLKREDNLGMTVRRLAALPDLGIVHARTTRAYPVHVATDVKVALIMDGAKRYDHRGRRHTAGRGSLVFADVGEAHGGCPATSRLDVIMLGIAAPLLARALGDDDLTLAPGGRFQSVVKDAALTRAFVGVCEAALCRETSILLVGERLDAFAAALMKRKPVVHLSFPSAQPLGEHAAVERVRQMLHASYADELSLGELAQVAGLPQPRFLREFRRQLGVSPHAYLLARNGFNPAWHFAFHNVPGLAENLLQGREEAYLRWWFTTGAARPDAFDEDDIREYVRAYSQPGAMRAGFEYYRAVFKDIDDYVELATKKLTIPVLAVGGERTFGPMVEQSLRAVAENVRGAVLRGCGHWVTEEKPDEVAALLLEFFSEKGRVK